MKQAAGTLLWRRNEKGLEVLLVHHSGGYNRKAPWSIPKGLLEEGETPEDAARRETFEETGIAVTGPLDPLGSIDYTKSKKRVFAFAGQAPPEVEPRCASWEIDCAEFMTLDRAREILHLDQRPFLERLERMLAPGARDS